MPITFRGTAVSSNIISNAQTTQHIFALVNHRFSRVNVIVRDIIVQNDAFDNLTAVAPIVNVSRVTGGVTGGITVPKTPLHPSQVSSDFVQARSAHTSGHNLTATVSSFLHRQFSARSHTGAEQRLFPTVYNNVYIGSYQLRKVSIIVRPNESLLVTITAGAVTQNPATANNWFAQVFWEEDELSTYTIGGVVSLSGSPISGAKVTILEALDIDLNDTILHEVKTTNALGEWSSTITTGRYGVAIAQYRVGTTYYTSVSRPYLGA